MPVSVDPTTKARLLRQVAGLRSMWIPAHGSSMGWTIPSGSSVRVVAVERPRRGELWAYCDDNGTVVVHRYAYRAAAGHILRGDASIRCDPARG